MSLFDSTKFIWLNLDPPTRSICLKQTGRTWEKWSDQHDMSVEQRKHQSPRQESNPRPLEHRAGALCSWIEHVGWSKIKWRSMFDSTVKLYQLDQLKLQISLPHVKFNNWPRPNKKTWKHQFTCLICLITALYSSTTRILLAFSSMYNNICCLVEPPSINWVPKPFSKMGSTCTGSCISQETREWIPTTKKNRHNKAPLTQNWASKLRYFVFRVKLLLLLVKTYCLKFVVLI